MSIENPSQGLPEEIEEAEKRLNFKEKILSHKRSNFFERISKEDRKLIDQCNLLVFESDNNLIIKGTIKDHNIHIIYNESLLPKIFCRIDDSEVSNEQAKRLFDKYFDIAVFQTRGSETELSKKQEGELDKEIGDNLAEKLLN
jgi:hypothetical protein